MITVPETFKTLETQVEKMADGTNPIVFFPDGTKRLPKLPMGCRSVNKGLHGTFYFNPAFFSEDLIDTCIKQDSVWALLGFVQRKEEAVKGKPIAVTVRDMNDNEIKTAVVDSQNEELVALQAYIFSQWFPNCKVESTTVFHIIAERLGDSDGTRTME
jgi:hypothetical protein